MKIGLIQTRARTSFKENIEQCLDFLVLAGKLELDMLLFPEMQFTGFFPRCRGKSTPFQWAEGIPGPTIEKFQRLAREFSLVVVLNYMERFNREFYNSSPVIDANGKLLGVSRMIHIPQMEGYYGRDYFTPSCGDFIVYPTRYARVGIMSSYDRHFPEVARSLALNEAQIILIPGYLSADQDPTMVRAELRTTAYQNSLFVGMAGRVGCERDVEYMGGSMLVNPEGKVLVEGSAESGIIIADMDLKEIQFCRKRYNYLKSRRPDEYMGIIRVYLNTL